MKKPYFMFLSSTLIISLLTGCGGGSSSSSGTSTKTIFTVERGSILNATVSDANGQVASNVVGSNDYSFENKVTYPVTATGGYIDVDNSGNRTSPDVDLDIGLSTYEGTSITLISTIIGEDRENNLAALSNSFSIDSKDLVLLPSQKKETALLTNLIYRELKTNNTLTTNDVIEKIKNNEVGIKEDYNGFDISSYENLTSAEFLVQTETDIINEINGSTQNSEITLKNINEYVDRYKVTRTTPSAYMLGSSQDTRINEEALVPPMCYTKHDAKYNPCYVCHQDNIIDGRATKIHDGVLQNEYAFSDYAFTNHWDNLFNDRTSKINAISDEEIQTYVNQDNYTPLITDLKSNGFVGYIPDIENFHLGSEAFEEDGFAKDGSGWVAFNYKPLPSTFWPVNGSTDDVIIRLSKEFRQDNNGQMSSDIYRFNLAIVEAAIKNIEEISVNALDENSVGVDLNNDGQLGIVNSIQRPKYYVGKASNIPVETFLYPLYTEFLHSVRYVGASDDNIYNAPRMKELRYMIKTRSYHDEVNPMNKTYLAILYDDEFQEKFEGNNVPTFNSLGEKGLDNGMGWWLQAFIEDAQGDLRPQTYEETFFCMGCHTNLGSTIDQVFSFARKVEGKDGWGYLDLKKIIDVPNVGEEEGEFLTYLKRVGGGSEFRVQNDIYANFYENGVLNENKVKSINSIYELITPSKKSALEMNKSYKVLVESQNFVHGRDGNSSPVKNVYNKVNDTTPTLPENKQYKWDMRLNWSK